MRSCAGGPTMPESKDREHAGAVVRGFSPDAIRERLSALEQRIRVAGGDPEKIRILAVSKTFPAAAVSAAREVGFREFGENYADELVAKARAFPDDASLRWHFIGAIQRNKLARLVPVTAVFEGVTRIEEGRDIARRAPGARIFVEVDATGLVNRPGVAIGEAEKLVDELRRFDLDVAGLMTVAAPGPPASTESIFVRVAGLARDLGLAECSMGMSDDLELAVGAGSTEIRIGTALFGPRGEQR